LLSDDVPALTLRCSWSHSESGYLCRETLIMGRPSLTLRLATCYELSLKLKVPVASQLQKRQLP
jgi:hypothetical protein